MPMLWRPHDRHRDIRTWTRSARLFARRNQDRHVMIEIASPATPQPSSLLPPRRRRSPNDAPGASANAAAAKNMIPLPTENTPRHALSFEIIFDSPAARQPTPATLKSP